MQEDAEIYEVKSIDENGQSVVVYVLPGSRRLVSKSMAEEYGNVEERGLSLSEVPKGVLPEN